MRIKYLIFILFFILNSIAFSQEKSLNNASEKNLSVQVSNSLKESGGRIKFAGFFQMIFIFLLLILFIYGIFFLIKKFSIQKIDEDGIINLIDSKGLGPNRLLHLVKIADEIYLISSTDNSINLISKINDKDTLEKLNLEISAIKSKGKKFGELIHGSSLNPIDFLKNIKNKIKKM